MFFFSVPGLLAIYAIYFISRAFYRLYLHPLSKFPGDKLAAVTRWYEFYWQVQKGGRYGEKIKEMHGQYGPIVRINPFELHIDDPAYYDELYNFNPDLDKRAYSFENLQLTPDFHLHKQRRRIFEPFFSRRNIVKLEPLVHDAVEVICKRLEEAKNLTQPLNMSLMYRCMTADIITDCLLSWSHGFVNDLTEGQEFLEAWDFRRLFLMRELPYFHKTLTFIFKSLAKLPTGYQPVDAASKWRRAVRNRVEELNTKEKVQSDASTELSLVQIFQTSDLPKEERTESFIMDNVLLFVTAGFETTGNTLSAAHYHILANPHILHTLKTELAAAWPDANERMSWTDLEKLPYLRAVVQESLRLSMGVMAPLSRVNHKSSMRYKDHVIPAHTVVGMSQPDIHLNETIFEEPWKFSPERWLDPEKAAYLEKHLVSFSRGARMCIGKHLAQEEIYVALASVFRRFDMELYETTRKDVDPARDFFVPFPEPGTKGLRVLVN